MSNYKIKFKFKSNKGTALIMAILIMVVLSLIGSAIVTLTVGNFQMSIFYDDVNKAYYIAENGVETIIKVLDEKVANIQETAKNNSSSQMQNIIQNEPIRLRDTPNDDGSVNYNSLSVEFDNSYNLLYTDLLGAEFSNIDSIDYKKELMDTEMDDGLRPYLEFIGGRAYFNQAVYNNLDNTVILQVQGVYNGYKKTLQITLDMNLKNESDENVVPYKVSVKEGKKQIPVVQDIFLDNAIIAEKNLIIAGGLLSVNGNILAFGKIPVNSEGGEDQNSNWYNYGGVLVGLANEITSASNEFGFNSIRTGSTASGSLDVNGSVATMGYISSVYGNNIVHSDIQISENAFARSLRSEVNSNFSNIVLNNLYTIDNLQIDSSMSSVTLNGIYYGMVDAGYMIDGSNENTEEKMLEDSYLHKRTSSVLVNGDSTLGFNSEIYIGGSTFINDYLEEGTDYPYMTGISVLKSSKRLSNAYTETGTGGDVYWYEHGGYTVEEPYYKNYVNDGNIYKMIKGKSDLPEYFPIKQRGLHFKGIWDNIWSTDDLYLSYLNVDSISIGGDGIENGKLKGYSNGAIVANGSVYGINDFVEVHDPVSFHSIQLNALETYHNVIDELVNDEFDMNYPKLNYVEPSESILDLIDYRFNGNNRVVTNVPYISSENPTRGLIFYGNGDIDISNNGSYWLINNRQMEYNKGIIVVDGNIYIDNGFTFTGILYATGNIIFLGDSQINYDRDVVLNILSADVNTKGFFKLLTYDIPNDAIERQRIISKSFDIIDWREIP